MWIILLLLAALAAAELMQQFAAVVAELVDLERGHLSLLLEDSLTQLPLALVVPVETELLEQLVVIPFFPQLHQMAVVAAVVQ